MKAEDLPQESVRRSSNLGADETDPTNRAT
jgi:hypothetical protein